MSEQLMKKAADELLKIADEIEKDAAEVTQFVCNKCNHTAVLAGINSKRQAAAKEAGEGVTVSDVTVNDTVQCPACDGVMAYKATEASEAYYFDPDKEAKGDPTPKDIAEEKKESPATQVMEEMGQKPHKEPHEGSKTASIDYDSLARYTA